MSLLLTRDDGLVLALDGYDAIRYSPRIRVTSHPVELGSAITDHAQKEALRFSIVNAKVTSVQTLVPKPLAVQQALFFFETAAGHLITVDTVRDGLFFNCMLTGWANDHTVKTGRTFQLEFEQITFATPIAVIIPARVPSPQAGAGMADEADAGVQPPAPVTFDATSALAAIANFVTG